VFVLLRRVVMGAADGVSDQRQAEQQQEGEEQAWPMVLQLEDG